MASLAEAARPFLALRALALVSGSAAAVVTARLLGPEQRGALALVVVVILAFAAVVGLGSPVGLYDAVRRGVTPRRAMVIGTLAAGATAAVAAIAWPPLSRLLLPGSGTAGGLAQAVGVGAASLVAAQASGMILLAGHRVTASAVVQALQPASALAFYLLAFLVLGASLESAVLAYAASCAAAATIGAIAIARRRSEPGLDPPFTPVTTRSVLGRGLRAMPGDAMNLLSYRLDVVVVGMLAGAASLGTYAVAVQLLEPLWIAASALAMAVMGTIRRGEFGDLDATLSASRAAAFICLAGALVITLLASLFGELALGEGYDSMPLTLLALAPGVGALAVSKVLAASVIAQGRLGRGSIVATITVAVNTLLNLLVVPGLGEVGAAISASVAYTVSAVAWIVVVREEHGTVGWRDLVPRRNDLRMARALLRPGSVGRKVTGVG